MYTFLYTSGGVPTNEQFETEQEARDWMALVKPEDSLALVWFGPEPTDNLFIAKFENGVEIVGRING